MFELQSLKYPATSASDWGPSCCDHLMLVPAHACWWCLSKINGSTPWLWLGSGSVWHNLGSGFTMGTYGRDFSVVVRFLGTLANKFECKHSEAGISHFASGALMIWLLIWLPILYTSCCVCILVFTCAGCSSLFMILLITDDALRIRILWISQPHVCLNIRSYCLYSNYHYMTMMCRPPYVPGTGR